MKERDKKPDICVNKEELKEANFSLCTGAGLGAYAGWTFTAGAVCPVCVVAAPALIGMGLWGRYKAKRGDSENMTENE